MTIPTVLIVCGAKGCGRVLATLDADSGRVGRYLPPEDDQVWTSPTSGIWVESCHRHGGIAGTIQDVDAIRAAKGLPPIDRSRLMHYVRWSEMRTARDESATRGRPSRIRVKPL